MAECVVCWEDLPEEEMYDDEICILCSENPNNGHIEATNIVPCANCGMRDLKDCLDHRGYCETCAEDNPDNSSNCEHCGQSADSDVLSSFDGLCEECASQGY